MNKKTCILIIYLCYIILSVIVIYDIRTDKVTHHKVRYQTLVRTKTHERSSNISKIRYIYGYKEMNIIKELSFLIDFNSLPP
jgi:uncharacterized protein YxeA